MTAKKLILLKGLNFIMFFVIIGIFMAISVSEWYNGLQEWLQIFFMPVGIGLLIASGIVIGLIDNTINEYLKSKFL